MLASITNIVDRIVDGFFERFYTAVEKIFFLDFQSFVTAAEKTFPSKAKCSFSTIGVGGDTESSEAVCAIHTNKLNRFLFAFLYLWQLFSLLLIALDIFFNMIICACKYVRYLILKLIVPDVDSGILKIVNRQITFGNFMFIVLLDKQIDPYITYIFINEIYNVIEASEF